MYNAAIKHTQSQVLEVYLDKQAFGIPIQKIQDVLEKLQLTGVPKSGSYIVGVANLRGRIVTAIDLRKRVGGSGSGESKVNVVLESNGELYSILVDRVGNVLTLDSSHLEEAPMTLNPAWRNVAQGIYQLDSSLLIVLDAEKIIHAD